MGYKDYEKYLESYEEEEVDYTKKCGCEDEEKNKKIAIKEITLQELHQKKLIVQVVKMDIKKDTVKAMTKDQRMDASK